MIFESSNFLVPGSTQDRLLQIRNNLGEIIYSISPCDVSRTYVLNDSLKLKTVTGNLSIKFISPFDATLALEILDNRINEIKSIYPCDSIIPEPYLPPTSTPSSTSIFSSDTFLTPYATGEKKVQIRNTLGSAIFTIDPCNVVMIYAKEDSKFVSIKSVGSENIIKIDFISTTDAAIASNKLQSRIDYIKGIYPCGGGGFAPGFEGLTFYQFTASATWSFIHPLGRTPSVSVYNFDGVEIGGLVKSGYSVVDVYFNTGLTGSVYLI